MTTSVDLSGRGHSAMEKGCHNGCPTSSGSFCGGCIYMGMLASSGPSYMGCMVCETSVVTELEKMRIIPKISRSMDLYLYGLRI